MATEIDQVATFFEEQSSIDEVIEEIREIENTISEEEQDLASLVKLRTVNLGFNQNKVSDEPNIVTAYDEEEEHGERCMMSMKSNTVGDKIKKQYWCW